MSNEQIIQAIGDKVTAIDLKMEAFLKNQEQLKDKNLAEMKTFFEELSRIVSNQFIGDLPRAVELLERKIGSFDRSVADSLAHFSDSLLSYENQLEERIKDEIDILQERLLAELDQHQKEQIEQLDEIARAINNVGSAISRFNASVRKIDFDKLNQNLENFETLLTLHLEQQNSKRSFFGKRK